MTPIFRPFNNKKIFFLIIGLSVFPTLVHSMEHSAAYQDSHSRGMRRLEVLGRHLQDDLRLGIGAANTKANIASTPKRPPAKEIFVNWHKVLRIPPLEKAVIVVGNTGAGKSTMIASLQRAPLFKNKAGNIELGATPDPDQYPVIGSKPFESETSYPAPFKAKNGLLFIDTPGVKDTDGPEYDMVHGVTLECTLKSVGRSRLLIIMDQDDINPSSKGQRFKEFASYFSPILGPNVLKSVLWIVTRASGREAAFLKNLENFKKSAAKKVKNEGRIRLLAKVFTPASEKGPTPAELDLKKEIDDLEKTLKMLDSINGNNIVFFDPLKQADCDNLLTRLEVLPDVSSKSFCFDTRRHDSFKGLSEEIIRSGVNNRDRRDALQKQSDTLGEELTFINGLSDEPAELKKKIQEEIEKNEEQLDALNKKKKQIAQKESDLEHNGKDVCLYDRRIEEKRWIGSLNWTSRSFEYTQSPITDVVPDHDKHGKFMRWDLEKAGGIFKAEYGGGIGCDAWAHVKVFGPHNGQRHVKILLESLKKQKETLTKSIGEIQGIIDDLQQKGGTAGPTRTQFDAKKAQLVAEKKAIDTKLTSIRAEMRKHTDLYQAISYVRDKLSLKNELDDSFQSLLQNP